MKTNSPLPLSLSALVLGSLLLAPAAYGQDAPVSPARQLFVDARKLIADGKYAEACPKLEESLRLEVGVGTQFNLADCWEHTGKTASARALFLGAAASAKAAGQADREQVLRDRAAALEPRLSRLVIEVNSTDPKLTVKRNDLPLDADALGKAEPVDPGTYKITARAPGKKTWEKTVEVKGSTPVTTIEVPALEDAEAAKPAAKPAPVAAEPEAKAKSEAPKHDAPTSQTSDRGPSTDLRVITLASVGVAGIGFGAVMGIKYMGTNGDAKDICPSSVDCTVKQIQEHDRLIDTARTNRNWSYAGFGVGAAFLASAGALWIFDRPSKKASSGMTWQAAPVVAADGSLGAFVNGRF
jgi:hypothetical protein